MRRDGLFLSAAHRRTFRELRHARAVDGWTLVAMNDETGRRGIWMRPRFVATNGSDRVDAPELHALEVSAGREGDDHRVTIYRGELLTGHQLRALYSALDVGRWMVEEGGTLDAG